MLVGHGVLAEFVLLAFRRLSDLGLLRGARASCSRTQNVGTVHRQRMATALSQSDGRFPTEPSRRRPHPVNPGRQEATLSSLTVPVSTAVGFQASAAE
jgi:hypothetical protein